MMYSEFVLVSGIPKMEGSMPAPQGDLDSIRGIVSGAPFDMARDGKQILGEAADASLFGRCAGELRILSDITKPVFSPEEFDMEARPERVFDPQGYDERSTSIGPA